MNWETYPFAKNIHLFRQGGLNIAYDVNSGSLHLLDDKAYGWLEEIIAFSVRNPGSEARPGFLSGAAGQALTAAERDEIMEEFGVLEREGTLFSAEVSLPPPYAEDAKPMLKAICLHLAHDCNLACRYCFAGAGTFGGASELMSEATGVRALDFAITQSGERERLEVDFFGGEPLLNAGVMRALVDYGRAAGARAGKRINFTLTTNALLLDDDTIDWLEREKIGVVLSLDGRPEVHDRMRPLRGGLGSYEAALPPILKIARRRAGASPYAVGDYYYVRGTYTRHNTDFDRDALHMADLGIGRISLEPVVGGGEDLDLTAEDLPALNASYDRLGEAYLAYAAEGRPFSFFHFNAGLDEGPCLPKRLKGCGAGIEYAAVTPNGDIYPCHQFAGREDWRLGSVYDEPAVLLPETARKFAGAHLNAKEACR
ncbi:MAG: thioether cross-link-forming SCIFF peptide maturase, partial [Gracilibacteraceae bacterium]|nr:thioether cross-link-forming SCIFF peptide maturase [Gracilibacteraceae bacterium]